MRRTTARLMLPTSWILVAMLQATSATAETYYVSPSGNDSHSGTPDAPFATLERARDAVRRARKQNPQGTTSVQLRGGRYVLHKPFELFPEDSGTAQQPVVYASYADEKPIFSGGEKVGPWRKHDNRLWVADVPWVRDVQETPGQLFVNGVRRIRARSPNVGSYFYTTRLQLGADQHPVCLGMSFGKADLAPWLEQPDVQIVLFHNWVNSYNRVRSVDWTKRRLEFTRPAGVFFLGAQVRYYVENAFAALDAPGEWYLDRGRALLFYYPPAGENMATAEAIVPRLSGPLVSIHGHPADGPKVQHLGFVGISFQHTDADLSRNYPHSVQGAHTQHGAFFARGMHRTVIERCEFTRLGEHAVSLREGCQANTVRQCQMYDLGGGGVYLSEAALPGNPSDARLTAHNVVDNNFIHDGGHIFRAACGVFLGGSASYNEITHNEICDLSWMGVHLGWSWTGQAPAYTHHNRVAYNHIHHLGGGVLNDIGGIYTLGVSPGTVLEYNLIHDVTRFERGREGYGGWGIYLDAGSSEIRVENNVVYNTRDGGLHLHCHTYPHDNTVTNNIFAGSADAQLIRNSNHEPAGMHVSLQRNIVLNANLKMLGGSNWKPGSKFSIDRNCYWSTATGGLDFAGRTLAAWQAEGCDKHSLVADPRFKNPAGGDFRLPADSPALAIGFQPIDLTGVGLHGPSNWIRLPQGIAHRAVETTPVGALLTTIADGFEDYAVGERPDLAHLFEENDRATIRVTAEQAATGKQCLKVTDAPGQRVAYDPHFAYQVDFPETVLCGAFDLRLEPGAMLQHEWRDWPNSGSYRAGPALHVAADGSLLVAGKKLLQLPPRQWVHFAIVCATGPAAHGRWELTVQIAGQEPRQFADLPCHAQFKKLTWYGFVSPATGATTFYLDNIKLQPARP